MFILLYNMTWNSVNVSDQIKCKQLKPLKVDFSWCTKDYSSSEPSIKDTLWGEQNHLAVAAVMATLAAQLQDLAFGSSFRFLRDPNHQSAICCLEARCFTFFSIEVTMENRKKTPILPTPIISPNKTNGNTLVHFLPVFCLPVQRFLLPLYGWHYIAETTFVTQCFSKLIYSS